MEKIRKGQVSMDEFALVLLAGIILIIMLMVTWTTPTEGLAVINPSSLSLQMEAGTTRTIDLEISGGITNVTLSTSGEIDSWITFNRPRIDKISNSTTVSVRINAPSSVTLRQYNGDITVKSAGGEKLVPVTIDISTPVLSSRSMLLPDFSIEYTPNTKTLDSKDNVVISKGYFSEQSESLVGTLDDRDFNSVVDGNIQLLVESTNNLGNLVIEFNGKEVFNNKVTTSFLEIPVNKSMIRKTNFIKIYATAPGWQFWATTTYKIRNVKFDVNIQVVSTVSFPFTLFDIERNNFNHFQLIARAKDYSTPIQEMQIAINGQIVFWQPPSVPFVNMIFSRDILGIDLFLLQNNTISFKLEKEVSYDFTNVMLLVFYRSF
jgi:hypothetical protein